MTKPIHSKIGASSCERWWNCPGSVALVASCPPQPESPYAAEGTAAHAMAERCLKYNMDATDCVGKDRADFTEEMAEAVQVYLDVIRADMAKYKVHVSDLAIEHRFHLVHIDENAYGTNDANLKVAFTKIIVYDYKHGAGVAVDAEDNKQGLYYAIGAAYGEEIDEIEVVIVQPRAIHKDGPVRRWTVSKADLNDFAEAMKERIAATKDPIAAVKAGDWCKKTFCPAMAICPAIRGRVEQDAMVVFTDKPLKTLPKPEELTPLMLRRLLEGMPLIEEWLKAVFAYAQQKANNGEQVYGFKLVRGREGNRKWKDESEVKKQFGEKCLEASVMSPTKFEKELGKKDFAAFAAAVVTRSEGKIILVPLDDPREEVNANITQVFETEQLT